MEKSREQLAKEGRQQWIYNRLKKSGALITEPLKKNSPAKIFTRMSQAEEFQKKQPVFYDLAGSFWIWNNDEEFWEHTDDIHILNRIEGETGADVITSKSRTEILNALKQVGRRKIPQPAEKTWIQFKNGLIDISKPDVDLLLPNPYYFITNPIPHNLGVNPETPNMDRIFKEWVGEENVQLLYEILAYCLIPDYPIHRIFCLIGAGMNGKSCYLNLLKKFVGSKNVTSTELDVLLNSRFEVTRLHKKLVCQMGETNFNEMSKTSILKKLTGGDLIGFEYKNKNPFEDINYAKIIISTNNLPTTSDKTIGFYRRWSIVDFNNQFTEKKNILDDIPDSEYENLARKCVDILYELLEKREFTNEGSIDERMKRYEDRSDPLGKFMREFTEEEPNSHIWKWEMEKRLNEWCKENRFREIASNNIGRKMKEKGIHQAYVKSDWIKDGETKQIRAWIGLKWKDEPVEKSG